MYKFLLSLLLLVIQQTNTKAEIWGINQILEATCRVDAGNAFGSGSCIDQKNGKIIVLTNAHVVGNSTNVKLEFFKNGLKTLPLSGKVIWRSIVPQSEIDFALIEVDERLFGKYPPRIAKLAPANVEAVGNYIASAGCPGARWPSGFEGFIIGKDPGRILFYPPPLGGQSGSGLYIIVKTEKGYDTYLAGVITWRIGGGVQGKTTSMGYEANHGGAISVSRLVDAVSGRVGDYSVPEHYQPVIFDKILNKPSYYRYTTTKTATLAKPKMETVPYIVDSKAVPKIEVINKDRLLPIIPRPNDNPEVTPDVTPDVPDSPIVPDNNPYGTIPDFNLPVEPPIAEDLNKEAEEKAKIEAEKARLEAEKKAAEEKSILYAWIAAVTGGGGIGALILAFLKKKGPSILAWFYAKKKPEIQDKIDNIEERLFSQLEERLEKRLGPKIAAPVVNKAKDLEEELLKKLEKKFLDRLQGNAEVVMQEVAFPAPVSENSMTRNDAQDQSLNEVAKAIIDENARMALVQFINRTITKMFEDRQ